MEQLLKKLAMVADAHTEYKKEAYHFVLVALHHTVEKLDEARHVSGQELSFGIREYAIDQFGPMAKTVLSYWGINTTYDFGKIVYYLIDAEVMHKTDEDSIEDFRDVYSFDDAFDQPMEYDI